MMKAPHTPRRYLYVLAILLCLSSCDTPAGAGAIDETAEQSTNADPTIAVLVSELADVGTKLVALAEAFTQSQYDWRPADGVRSSAEVLMHVAAINYAFPILAGHEAPASTGLTRENLPTAAPAYEASLSDKDGIRRELGKSLEHVRTAVESTSDLERQVTVFGDSITLRSLWVGHVGHLHEHLGQLIAYARTNGVVPPWSR